jgi:hypothetical protein
MRRIGAWIGVFVLLAGVWGVWRWLGDARPVDAPHAARIEQVAPDRDAARLAEVAEDVAPREAATGDVERPDVQATASEAAPEAPEFACVVRVVDVLDAPIEGARVWIPKSDEIQEQVTDAQGRCTLRGDINAFMMVEVAVEAEGYFHGAGMLVGQPEHVVQLRRAAQASGRVLDSATRAPVANARVASKQAGGDVEADSATTDASGRFEGLAVPESATFLVAVEARGYLSTGVRAMTIAGDPADPAAALELLLDPAQPGFFRVVDSEDGQPLRGAKVNIARSTSETDAEGRVHFDSALRPTDLVHWATVSAEDHCTATYELQGSGTSDAPVVIRLPRACRVEGVVRAAAGTDLPRCLISVHVDGELAKESMRSGRLPDGPDSADWPDNARWNQGSLRTTFDPRVSGRIEIAGVPPGLPGLRLSLFNEAGTLSSRRIGPMGPSGSTLSFDWVLEPAGTAGLTGRVLLNGEPHGGSVRVERDGIERVTTTGEDGVYVLEKLSAGVVELRCELQGGNTRWGDLGVQTSTVELTQGEVAQRDIDFQFAVSTIRGTLGDAGGAPQAGVRLEAASASNEVRAWCETRPDGSWSFQVPHDETLYRLTCRRPLREHGIEVPAGTEGLALHLLAQGRLRFRALDAVTGEPLTSVVLAKSVAGNLAQPIGGPNWPEMEASGWCEKELTAGPIELAAFTHDGVHRADRRSLDIPTEGVCEVEFRLGPAVSVELRLAPGGGALPERHVLQLLPEAEWEFSTATLGPGYPSVSFEELPFDPTRQRDIRLWPGRGVLVGSLAPGRYRFKVFPDDVRIEPEWIDVPAEGVVDVRWSQGP